MENVKTIGNKIHSIFCRLIFFYMKFIIVCLAFFLMTPNKSFFEKFELLFNCFLELAEYNYGLLFLAVNLFSLFYLTLFKKKK